MSTHTLYCVWHGHGEAVCAVDDIPQDEIDDEIRRQAHEHGVDVILDIPGDGSNVTTVLFPSEY